MDNKFWSVFKTVMHRYLFIAYDTSRRQTAVFLCCGIWFSISIIARVDLPRQAPEHCLRWTSISASVFLLFDSRVRSNSLFSRLTMPPRGGQISILQDVAAESQSFFTFISGTPSRRPTQIRMEYRWARWGFHYTPIPSKCSVPLWQFSTRWRPGTALTFSSSCGEPDLWGLVFCDWSARTCSLSSQEVDESWFLAFSI